VPNEPPPEPPEPVVGPAPPEPQAPAAPSEPNELPVTPRWSRPPEPAGAGGAGERDGPRASDADRERTAERLYDHYAEGRIGLEEFERRTDAALKAERLVDLYQLTSDLPYPSVPLAAKARGPLRAGTSSSGSIRRWWLRRRPR